VVADSVLVAVSVSSLAVAVVALVLVLVIRVVVRIPEVAVGLESWSTMPPNTDGGD